MQEKLIIFLQANDLEQVRWAVIDAKGEVRQSAVQDKFEGLVSIAEDKEIIICVPAEDVLLTTVNLPKMSQSRLLQALPFALEEQVNQDVEELHIVPITVTGDVYDVAVVSHNKMKQWQSLLSTWGIQPNVMISSVMSLPYGENTWSVRIGEICIVRTGKFQGFACDKKNLAEMMAIALHDTKQTPIQINVESDGTASLQDPNLPIQTTILTPAQLLASAAMVSKTVTGFNLLQGSYASKKSRFPQAGKLLKVTMALSAAWVFALIAYPAVSYFILENRVKKIEGEIVAIYKQNFPRAASVVAPKLRMEDKLKKMAGSGSESRLLLLLAKVGKAMTENNTIKLKRIDFQNNVLTLELSATSSDDFSQFSELLQRDGLSVKQQNATLNGERVNATLAIE